MKKVKLLLIISLFLVGCKKDETVSKDQYNTMYTHLVDCWNQSLNGMHFDNVFYGDSRVIGGNFVDEFKDKSVINLGVGGDKINDLINRYKLIETTTPDRVFLAIGGNDCLSSSFSITTFKEQYTTLLDMFKEDNIDVIIHNIVGITTINAKYSKKDVENANEKISKANTFIEEIARLKDYTFIDIASIMNKEGTNEMNGNYSQDGVHFNEDGYKVWFDTIKDYLK